jgi:hypothetical protein
MLLRPAAQVGQALDQERAVRRADRHSLGGGGRGPVGVGCLPELVEPCPMCQAQVGQPDGPGRVAIRRAIERAGVAGDRAIGIGPFLGADESGQVGAAEAVQVDRQLRVVVESSNHSPFAGIDGVVQVSEHPLPVVPAAVRHAQVAEPPAQVRIALGCRCNGFPGQCDRLADVCWLAVAVEPGYVVTGQVGQPLGPFEVAAGSAHVLPIFTF